MAPRHEQRTVPPEFDGQRLDRFLAETLDLSRSRLQTLIRKGWVRVNGQVEKPGFRVATGFRVDVEIPPPAVSHLVAQPLDLDILHEDEDLLVVNKPPGLVVHPGAGNPDNTLVNALVHHCPDIEGVGGVRRPGLIHRLDKDTSGAMLVAKTERAFAGLTDAMKRREIGRRYLAVLWGGPEAEGRIEAPIGRDPRHRKQMAVTPGGGRDALTLYRVLGRFDFLSLVELTLRTGRTHQIRVHLAHIGFPVFGDPVYGGRRLRISRLPREWRPRAREALLRIDRQALHAWSLEFRHPVSGRDHRFEAPQPMDFAALVAWMRQGGRPAAAEEG